MTGPRHRRPTEAAVVRRRRLVAGTVAVVVVVVVAAAGLAAHAATAGHGPPAPAHPGPARPTGSRPAPTTSAPPVANPVTIAAVGDTELGNTPDLPPDPAAYLAPIDNALAAPIVFGNLEGTMTDAVASKCAPQATDCYAFRVPTSDAAVMRQAGFTVLNSANNHSHDFGDQGVADTSAALQAAGIVQAGLPGQIGLVSDGTTKVAFVDFAPYTNVNDLLDLSTARQLIVQAKAEANVVVVYMHAGAEGSEADHVTGQEEYYVGEDRGNPEVFAHAAIDDGADLVLASGPHVLRGIEYYQGRLIDYSLGDFANYGDFSSAGDLDLSGILKVTLAADGTLVGAHFTSVLLSPQGQPAPDPSGAAAQFVNQLSSADFGAAAATIEPNGDLAPPPAG